MPLQIEKTDSREGLRKGFTTGSCAAAAGKGAVLMLLTGREVKSVSIPLPGGQRVSFELVNHQLSLDTAACGVIKDAGDDPDATHGAIIMASAAWRERGFFLFGGEGVGVVTKAGLQVPVGEAAINPVPRRMITEAVREVTERGVEITISVPNGVDLARRTFNHRLGIVGGISIIGTTGIVEPKSVEAFKTSLLCALDIAKAQGHDSLILVPGKIGESGIRRLLRCEEDQLIQTGNFVGFVLEAALERGFKSVLLAGHPGKLLKLVSGYFQTHSAHSDSALPVLLQALSEAHRGLAESEPYKSIGTVEGFIKLLPRHVQTELFQSLAEKVQGAAEEYVKGKMEVGVVLLSMDGTLVGESMGARSWRAHR